MRVVIVKDCKERIPQKFINSVIENIVKQLSKERLIKSQLKNFDEIILVFLSKRHAQKLNNQFRGKDYATDVLSFLSKDPKCLGELILCPQVLRAQAKQHSLSFQQELTYMLIHGILHLLGYDHEKSQTEAKQMFTIQDRIFYAIFSDGIK